jgi:hypothetical protein
MQTAKFKINPKIKILKSKFIKLGLLAIIWNLTLGIGNPSWAAEENVLEINLDTAAPTQPLPQIFKPGIDLSGRGLHRELAWPQAAAAPEPIFRWQKEVGFDAGLYRLQYSFWEISQFAKARQLQDKLLANYEKVIKSVSDAGGVVVLNIYGTPAGLGKVLDKKSPPLDLKEYKELIKNTIRYFSCEKKYNVWYEIWDAPDLDDFFLGKRQEYLNLYRAAAEAVKELRAEYKLHIPLGGPSTSWWFQSPEGNTIITPEHSLIYELIKFCYRFRLPLDFISWHSYSTDPQADKEATIYRKPPVQLIRAWLGYFDFDRDTPLIVDEWNYDRNANLLPERKEKAHIAAAYLFSRLKNMREAGLDRQVFFCLEDFQDNKEGVVRNVGVFSFDPEHSGYRGWPKAIYSAFRMLGLLGKNSCALKLDDEFVGALAAKDPGPATVIIYNYIDPDIGMNFVSRNISTLGAAERKIILAAINSGKLEKFLRGELEVGALRVTKKIRALLKKAKALSEAAQDNLARGRKVKLVWKNLPKNYRLLRYEIGSTCAFDCEFAAAAAGETNGQQNYELALDLHPYSTVMLVLEELPPPQEKEAPVVAAANATESNASHKD